MAATKFAFEERTAPVDWPRVAAAELRSIFLLNCGGIIDLMGHLQQALVVVRAVPGAEQVEQRRRGHGAAARHAPPTMLRTPPRSRAPYHAAPVAPADASRMMAFKLSCERL